MTSYVQRVFRSVAPLQNNSLIKANEEISVMWAQVKSKTRLNACIPESNFVSDMTKKRGAAAHFALLFASLAILRLASA